DSRSKSRSARRQRYSRSAGQVHFVSNYGTRCARRDCRCSGRASDVSRIGGYETAPDATAADWIALGLRGFAESVLSLVPAGFEAYARIFHPAARAEAPTRVRWQEVATANGRVAHPAMQWPSIVKTHGFADGGSQPGLWD